MATKRKRGNSWEFTVRRKHVLEKPFYATFDTEEEGDEYCRRLEKLLDAGIVPEELQQTTEIHLTLRDVIRQYLQNVAVTDSDERLLGVLIDRIGKVSVTSITYNWAENWVSEMKKVKNLSPTTIRHHVGALARCLDWQVRKKNPLLLSNPLRLLPKRYASYTRADGSPDKAKTDTHRERRLLEGEEKRIFMVFEENSKPDDKQRPLELKHKAALKCLFLLATETAMRLREMYTLTPDQIDLPGRTVYLEKTKNGDKRQVPLSSVAIQALTDYEYYSDTVVFPWWDGKDLSERNLRAITSLLSKQFKRIFTAANCEGLRFHDLRHEATSRLYERTKLSDLQISKITGHKDLKMLRRYANLRASDLAEELW